MALITASNLSAALQDFLGKNQKLNKIMFGQKHRVAVNMFARTSFGGSGAPQTVMSDWGGLVSATFSDAQATRGTAPSMKQFDPGATLAAIHRAVGLDSETIGRLRKDPQKLLSEAVLRTTALLDTMLDYVEWSAWRDGWGALDTIGSISSATVTLTNAANAKFFPIGARIVFAAADGSTDGDALRDSGDYLTVIAKDPIAGTVTFDDNLSEIASCTAGDYMFLKGSTGHGTTAARKCIHGADAWASTPSSGESFLGVDRSTNPAAYAMLTGTGDSADIQAAIMDNAAIAYDVNGSVHNMVVLNPRDLNSLAQQIGVQTQYEAGSEVLAGYSYVEINGVGGQPMRCVSSPYVDRYDIWQGQKEVPEWFHLYDNLAQIDANDGSTARKIEDASGIEIRGMGYAQLSFGKGPGNWMKVVVS